MAKDRPGRAPLPGQLDLPFGRRVQKASDGPYDPLLERPITATSLAAYDIVTADGEHYIQLWSSGSTISEAREHFRRIHPEHKKFTIGILGVGEFRVDSVAHAYCPDSRVLDQDGYVTLREERES